MLKLELRRQSGVTLRLSSEYILSAASQCPNKNRPDRPAPMSMSSSVQKLGLGPQHEKPTVEKSVQAAVRHRQARDSRTFTRLVPSVFGLERADAERALNRSVSRSLQLHPPSVDRRLVEEACSSRWTGNEEASRLRWACCGVIVRCWRSRNATVPKEVLCGAGSHEEGPPLRTETRVSSSYKERSLRDASKGL